MSRSLLTTAQQARIAGTITDYLPTDNVVILRYAGPTNDGKGGVVQTWAEVGPAVPALITAWVGRAGGGETAQFGAFEEAGNWKISLPAGTDVKAVDRIQRQDGSRTWEVKFVVAVESLEVLRECICVERLSG